MRDAHLCCGSAGTYSILQPELAQRLLDKQDRRAHGGRSAGDRHREYRLPDAPAERPRTQPVRHWIELVDELLSQEAASKVKENSLISSPADVSLTTACLDHTSARRAISGPFPNDFSSLPFVIHSDAMRAPLVLFRGEAYDRRLLLQGPPPMQHITRLTLEERGARPRHRRVAKSVFLEGSPDCPGVPEELWTSRQRQACSIHEVSYRACFKPQLPAYFIERLSAEGDIVYDPFSGRGTTAVEAALRGRRVIANDINPLSADLRAAAARSAARERSRGAPERDRLERRVRATLDLSMFFHRGHRARAAQSARLPQCPPPLTQRGRHRPLDPHGRDQPADRAFAGLLLGLHAAAEPGRVARRGRSGSTSDSSRSRHTATCASSSCANRCSCRAGLSIAERDRLRRAAGARALPRTRLRCTRPIDDRQRAAHRHLAAVSRRRAVRER